MFSLALAVAVFVLSILILESTVRPAPVAASFARVGGATRVETAADAGRFWLDTPKFIVTVASTASGPAALHAANCAIANDAPLLFTPGAKPLALPSKSITRSTELAELLSNWLPFPIKAAVEKPGDYEVIKNGRVLANPPHDCLHHAKWPVRMRTLTVNTRVLPNGYRQNPQGELGQFVVFASSVSPSVAGERRDLPDVAVGLALAAHIATKRAGRHGVSFVVVPQNLEADPDLEARLRDQHSAVLDGVVLGSPARISEDTRVLLRQILREPERSAVLGAIQSVLGDGGSLAAAILALLGVFAVAAREAPVIAEAITSPGGQFVHLIREEKRKQEQGRTLMQGREGKRNRSEGEGPGPTGKSESWTQLDPSEFDQALVFVYLHSGRVVSGTYEGVLPLGSVSCIRLNNAEMVSGESSGEGSRATAVTGESGEVMLVPVQQVELAIKVRQQPAAAKPSGE